MLVKILVYEDSLGILHLSRIETACQKDGWTGLWLRPCGLSITIRDRLSIFIYHLISMLHLTKTGLHTALCVYTELDTENPDLLPYLIRHEEKIGSTQVMLVTQSEESITALKGQPAYFRRFMVKCAFCVNAVVFGKDLNTSNHHS